MKVLAAVALAGSAALAAASPGASTGAGRITGRILYRGSAPEPRPIVVPSEVGYCGSRLLDERLVVGPDDGLRDAVVWIRQTPAGPALAPREARSIGRARLDVERCAFRPHVQAVAVGQVLEVRNLDPGGLRAHALWSGEDTAFDVDLPIQNQLVCERIKRPGVLHLQGHGSLGFMTAYVVALEHSFAAVTAADGSFSLEAVPPGSYTLEIWHEALGTDRTEVTVEAGEVSRIEHSLAAR